MIRNNHILRTVFLLIGLMASMTLVGQDNTIDYRFHLTDSTYSFNGSFEIKADAECLLDLAFDIVHLRNLVPDAKEVTLLGQQHNHNQVKYVFKKYLIFVNISVWERVLDQPGLRVEFTMRSSKNNLSIMPQLLSSTGYYQIIKKGDHLLMEYYHECKVTVKSITRLYLNRLKDEAIGFLYHFYDYACRNCNCSAFSTHNYLKDDR